MNRRYERRRAIPRRLTLGLLLPFALALASLPAATATHAIQIEDDETSFTDSTFGWTITWDPETWDAEGPLYAYAEDETFTGITFLGKDFQALGQVTILGMNTYADDAAACRDDLGSGEAQGISDIRKAELDLPSAPADAEQGLYLAVVDQTEFLAYVECRPLVEDEAVLAISWQLPDPAGYKDGVPLVEELLGGLALKGDQTADEESGDEDDQATAEPDDEGAAELESYTDPIFGWSIVWDPETWEAEGPIASVGEDDKPGNEMDFLGEDYEAMGYVRVASLATVSLDPAACVDFFKPVTSDELQGDGGFVENRQEPDVELPAAPSDAAARLFTFDAGTPPDQMRYLECRTLVEGEAVLIIDWYLPDFARYEEALPAFEQFIDGLDLSGAHAADEE